MVCAGFLFLVLFVLACSILLLQRQFRFSPRTATDVIAIARCVDERELEDLFDQSREETLHVGISAPQFQQAQRARSRLLFEYLRRMGFNSMGLLDWAYAAQKRLQIAGMPEDHVQVWIIEDIVDIGTQFRAYFAVAMFRLSVRLLLDELRIVRIRRLSKLQYVAGIDGLDSYRRLAQTAVALTVAQGSNAGVRLAVLLRGGGSAA